MLKWFVHFLDSWKDIFPQIRTHHRMKNLAIALVCCLSDKTVAAALRVMGHQDRDPSPENRIFSRSTWDCEKLYEPIFQEAANHLPQKKYLPISFDDTRIPKSGKRIPGAGWHRDPLGPPFQTNLIWGLRYLQASILLPLYKMGCRATARAIPVAFLHAPSVKKPPKNARAELQQEYERQKKKQNLSKIFMGLLRHLRLVANRLGFANRLIIAVADGSFCNSNTFTEAIKGVAMLCRCRKDVCLCLPDLTPSRRFYGEKKFTPNQVLKDDTILRKKATVFYAGKFRTVHYKEVDRVLWQGGAKRRFLRLLTVSGLPARKRTKASPEWHRSPAYLLTTDLRIPAQDLIEMYFDRWEIEVNHREEKSFFKIGDGQQQTPQSVSHWIPWMVALYSILILSSIRAYGLHHSTGPYRPIAKWQRKKSQRPTINDRIILFRQEVLDHHDQLLEDLNLDITQKTLLEAA